MEKTKISYKLDSDAIFKNRTTVYQFELLVEFMEKHPLFALNRADKESHKKLWDEVTLLLNSNGPPMKSRERWMKVWADLKSDVKMKVRTRAKTSKFGSFAPKYERVIKILRLRPNEHIQQSTSSTNNVFSVEFVDPMSVFNDDDYSEEYSTTAMQENSSTFNEKFKRNSDMYDDQEQINNSNDYNDDICEPVVNIKYEPNLSEPEEENANETDNNNIEKSKTSLQDHIKTTDMNFDTINQKLDRLTKSIDQMTRTQKENLEIEKRLLRIKEEQLTLKKQLFDLKKLKYETVRLTSVKK